MATGFALPRRPAHLAAGDELPVGTYYVQPVEGGYSMLLQMLVEGEARRDDETLPQDARDRSAETVGLCCQRMAMEGLNRDRLEQHAKAEA